MGLRHFGHVGTPVRVGCVTLASSLLLRGSVSDIGGSGGGVSMGVAAAAAPGGRIDVSRLRDWSPCTAHMGEFLWRTPVHAGVPVLQVRVRSALPGRRLVLRLGVVLPVLHVHVHVMLPGLCIVFPVRVLPRGRAVRLLVPQVLLCEHRAALPHVVQCMILVMLVSVRELSPREVLPPGPPGWSQSLHVWSICC